MTIRASQVKNTFFNHSSSSSLYPQTYTTLWNQNKAKSLLVKTKSFLKDYTKEQCILGSFWGLLFTGHWNRHHVSAVSKMINYLYESLDDLLFDLKQLQPIKGGSLDKRIHFVEEQIDQQLNYL